LSQLRWLSMRVGAVSERAARVGVMITLILVDKVCDRSRLLGVRLVFSGGLVARTAAFQ